MADLSSQLRSQATEVALARGWNEDDTLNCVREIRNNVAKHSNYRDEADLDAIALDVLRRMTVHERRTVDELDALAAQMKAMAQ